MFDRQSHIVLKADADGEAFLQRTMSARRYKRMAKNRADLARLGRLESKLHTDPGEVMVALRHFLELEAAGWKGRENGAILKKPDALRFFLRTICDLAEAGRIRLDALELDGVPIGMSIVALSGHTAYCWKTTFDERYAKYSPGMLTVMDVTRGIIADPTIRFADSCTDAGHPLMSHVWSDTAETVDVLVDLEPGGSDRGFALAVATEGARRRGRAAAKRLYHAVRNRLRGRRK